LAGAFIGFEGQGSLCSPQAGGGRWGYGVLGRVRPVFPTTRQQRCWLHKTFNILDKLPKSLQSKAKADVHNIWMAETKEEAGKAFDSFVEKYQTKYPKATTCLEKDRQELLAFYDFPAEHWKHIRTTKSYRKHLCDC
jgi:transposase-like protein